MVRQQVSAEHTDEQKTQCKLNPLPLLVTELVTQGY